MTIQDFLSPQVLFVVGLGMVTWVIVRARARGKNARPHLSENPPASLTSARDVRDLAHELAQLTVDLQETTRRVTAQIDNRYSKLDAILAQADARIRKLEELEARLSQLPASSAPSAPAADPRYTRIYQLSDRGLSPREIAQQVGQQPGEIELILSLRPRAD